MADEGDKNIKTDDEALFRREMRRMGTRPIRGRQRVPAPAPQMRAKAAFTRRDEQQVLSDMARVHLDATPDLDDEGCFQRPGVPRRTLRQLRRGQIAVQDEIDLHGLRLDEAKNALRDFLARCTSRRLACVRVIHGKGLGSGPAGPVLRPRVRSWLAGRKQVLAFCSAPRSDGGSGALYVLLKN